MRSVIVSLLFVVFSGVTFGQQPTPPTPAPTPGTVAVEQFFLAKDSGEGSAGEETTSFATTDVPIFCVVQLTSTEAVTVRMQFVAVKVAGVKAETKVVSVSYRTNGKQDRVSFKGRPEKLWSAGTYRIDIFLDDKIAESRTFEIVKAVVKDETVTRKSGKSRKSS